VVIKAIDSKCTVRDQFSIGDRIISLNGNNIRSVSDLTIGSEQIQNTGVIKCGQKPISKSLLSNVEVDLPPPISGNEYFPIEAIQIFTDQSGCFAGDLSIIYVRLVKETMIERNLIPVRISALNKYIWTYRDNKIPPLRWNVRGRNEIMTMSELAIKFYDHQKRVARLWLI